MYLGALGWGRAHADGDHQRSKQARGCRRAAPAVAFDQDQAGARQASRSSPARPASATVRGLMPIHTIQIALLATIMIRRGCTKLAIIDKRRSTARHRRGTGLAAKDQGLGGVIDEGIEPKAPDSVAGPEGEGRRRGLLHVRRRDRQQPGPGDEGLRLRARPGQRRAETLTLDEWTRIAGVLE